MNRKVNPTPASNPATALKTNKKNPYKPYTAPSLTTEAPSTCTALKEIIFENY